jgi:hypothetical protein
MKTKIIVGLCAVTGAIFGWILAYSLVDILIPPNKPQNIHINLKITVEEIATIEKVEVISNKDNLCVCDVSIGGPGMSNTNGRFLFSDKTVMLFDAHCPPDRPLPKYTYVVKGFLDFKDSPLGCHSIEEFKKKLPIEVKVIRK